MAGDSASMNLALTSREIFQRIRPLHPLVFAVEIEVAAQRAEYEQEIQARTRAMFDGRQSWKPGQSSWRLGRLRNLRGIGKPPRPNWSCGVIDTTEINAFGAVKSGIGPVTAP